MNDTLSDKILPCTWCNSDLESRDVKQFIDMLKSEITGWNMGEQFKGYIKVNHVVRIIDKLAGDELCTKSEEEDENGN